MREFLERRRKIARLAILAAGSMGVISLYGLGGIKHLPDPPVPGFDSNRVDASEEAYALFHAADGPIGLDSYAATSSLAAMAGRTGRRSPPHTARPRREGRLRCPAGRQALWPGICYSRTFRTSRRGTFRRC